ncbi:hypothetical protein TcYC6_0014720 [Trypanosoma cruzi]|nr:hypothetical protein TcYC6_0014720 [Trypanosoma cruzi]
MPVESHKNTVPQPHVDEGSEVYDTNWSDDGNCRSTGMTPQSVGPPGARAAAAQSSSGNTGMGERTAIETPAAILGRVVGFTLPFGGAEILNIFLTVSGINWFFMILSTTLSQLDVVGGGCYTFWGFKSSCDTVSYTNRTQLLSCKGYIRPLQTGAAFSIFSIFLMTAALFLASGCSWAAAPSTERAVTPELPPMRANNAISSRGEIWWCHPFLSGALLGFQPWLCFASWSVGQ